MNFIKLNRLKFAFRSGVLLLAVGIALIDYEFLSIFFYYRIGFIRVYHILWGLLMFDMIQVCIPSLNNYVSCGKLFAKHFQPSNASSIGIHLEAITNRSNKGAIRSAVFWTIIMVIIGSLYYNGVIDKGGLLLIGIFFYFSDQFCINVWCPFRAWLAKSKCCNTCRIYNWGHFMIVSPMIFIGSFWTISLVIASLLILLQWEWQHYRYPERFSEQTNDKLKCQNCMKAQCSYIKTGTKAG
jgi:hypothetical protein